MKPDTTCAKHNPPKAVAANSKYDKAAATAGDCSALTRTSARTEPNVMTPDALRRNVRRMLFAIAGGNFLAGRPPNLVEFFGVGEKFAQDAGAVRDAGHMRMQTDVHHHAGTCGFRIKRVELLLHGVKYGLVGQAAAQQQGEIVHFDRIRHADDRAFRGFNHVRLVVIHQITPELHAVLDQNRGRVGRPAQRRRQPALRPYVR